MASVAVRLPFFSLPHCTMLRDGLALLHVAAGATALVSGLIAMTSRKGARYHLLSGKVYFWSMAVVAGTAVPMAVFRPNIFLLAVAVFSFYFTFSGYRVIMRHRLGKASQASWVDWAAIGSMLLASVGLLLYGIGPANGSVVPIAFAVLGMLLGMRDVHGFLRTPQAEKPYEWWRTHIVAMLGAYIATFTAFIVTNATFLPVTVRWLGPTMLGTIGIIVCVRRYQKAMAARRESVPSASP